MTYFSTPLDVHCHIIYYVFFLNRSAVTVDRAHTHRLSDLVLAAWGGRDSAIVCFTQLY